MTLPTFRPTHVVRDTETGFAELVERVDGGWRTMSCLVRRATQPYYRDALDGGVLPWWLGEQDSKRFVLAPATRA